MYRGYIKLYRKILDNALVWKDTQTLAIWIYLLLKATYWWLDTWFNGQRLTLKNGQLISGRKKIAKELDISESKVQRTLKLFEKCNQIEQQTTSEGRLITIVNWNNYQYHDQSLDSKPNSQWTSIEQQANTYKESNNIKKNNNITLNKLKKKNAEIDLLIKVAKSKCSAYWLIYDPSQERRYANNLIKKEFNKKIEKFGFQSSKSFVESIFDLSMQPWNWRNHKICGLKDVFYNYPKVYSGYLDSKKNSNSIITF